MVKNDLLEGDDAILMVPRFDGRQSLIFIYSEQTAINSLRDTISRLYFKEINASLSRLQHYFLTCLKESLRCEFRIDGISNTHGYL